MFALCANMVDFCFAKIAKNFAKFCKNFQKKFSENFSELIFRNFSEIFILKISEFSEILRKFWEKSQNFLRIDDLRRQFSHILARSLTGPGQNGPGRPFWFKMGLVQEPIWPKMVIKLIIFDQFLIKIDQKIDQFLINFWSGSESAQAGFWAVLAGFERSSQVSIRFWPKTVDGGRLADRFFWLFVRFGRPSAGNFQNFRVLKNRLDFRSKIGRFFEIGQQVSTSCAKYLLVDHFWNFQKIFWKFQKKWSFRITTVSHFALRNERRW